jgi:hypothetical protein
MEETSSRLFCYEATGTASEGIARASLEAARQIANSRFRQKLLKQPHRRRLATEESLRPLLFADHLWDFHRAGVPRFLRPDELAGPPGQPAAVNAHVPRRMSPCSIGPRFYPDCFRPAQSFSTLGLRALRPPSFVMRSRALYFCPNAKRSPIRAPREALVLMCL